MAGERQKECQRGDYMDAGIMVRPGSFGEETVEVFFLEHDPKAKHEPALVGSGKKKVREEFVKRNW